MFIIIVYILKLGIHANVVQWQRTPWVAITRPSLRNHNHRRRPQFLPRP